MNNLKKSLGNVIKLDGLLKIPSKINVFNEDEEENDIIEEEINDILDNN